MGDVNDTLQSALVHIITTADEQVCEKIPKIVDEKSQQIFEQVIKNITEKGEKLKNQLSKGFKDSINKYVINDNDIKNMLKGILIEGVRKVYETPAVHIQKHIETAGGKRSKKRTSKFTKTRRFKTKQYRKTSH